MIVLKRLIYVIIILAFVSCNTTKTTVSWKKPDNTNWHFQKVAVIGLVGNLTARQDFEREVAKELAHQGMLAIGSMNFLSPGTRSKDPDFDRLTRL